VTRVYIHELVDIIGHGRADYLQHITANWGPIGREQRRQRCFGVWGTVGSTGRWPQVVNLWEYASWADLAHNFEVELDGSAMQDPALAEWWAAAARMRSGGLDRILVAPDWSPSLDDLMATAGSRAGYAHELVRCHPGAAPDLLEAVHHDGEAAYRSAGLTLAGAFRRAMSADDEVVLLWSFPDWPAWGAFEEAVLAPSTDVASWRARVAPGIAAWDRTLLVDAELSPLRTGRQPEESDRRPLEGG
jgi:hypothetical protein